MGALLALIPAKDWLYGSAIAALLVGFAVYTAHERSVGAAHEKAAVERAVATQNRKIEGIVANANIQVKAAEIVARQIASAPIAVDAPHLWVRDGAQTGACPVQADHGAGSRLDAALVGAAQAPRDIGPAIDTTGRDADAEIVYLQSYIRACQQAGYCSK